MAESCNTSCECTANVGIDKSKFCCLIEVLIVHVMDKIQGVYVDVCEPFHHIHELRHELFIGNHVAFDWAKCWTALLACLVVYTTADSVSQALCKVCTCTEELHFLTCLCCRYAAAD